MPRGRGGLQGPMAQLYTMTPPSDPQSPGLVGLAAATPQRLNRYWRGGVAGAPIEYAPMAPSADHYRITNGAGGALEALAAGEPPLLFNHDDEPTFHELAATQERQWSSPSRIFEGPDVTGSPIGVRWANPEAWRLFGFPSEPVTATFEETQALFKALGLPFNPVIGDQ